MATKITVSYQGKEYTLEYTRQTVRQLESQGFILAQLVDKPVTMMPLLFYGAFLQHHKGIKRSLVDEMYENMLNKVGDEGLVNVLIEMYSETINTLTEDKEIEEGNAATWKVVKG